MSLPIELQGTWLGMFRDAPRDGLPAGRAWNMIDLIPQRLSAPLQRRGGFSYASPALGSCTYVQGIVRTPEYGAGAFNLAVGSDGHVYKYTNGTSSDIGTAFAVSQNPYVHRATATAWMVVIPAASGTTTPKSYDGTTFGDLAGTPPQGKFGAAWNDYAVLANGTMGGTLYTNRLWFSAAGNCTSGWDNTYGYVDFKLPIVGVGILRTGLLAFAASTTYRLRGTTPPRTPLSAGDTAATGDLTEDRPYDVGCVDARSICNWMDSVIWADISGVYSTDGVTLKDLTAIGGMKSYWKDLLLAYTTGWSVAAGVYKDCVIVSVLDNNKVFQDCLVFDMLRECWYRFSNISALCFARTTGIITNVGMANLGRVFDMGQIINDGNGSDADGTAILPVLETGSYRGWTRLHRKWVPSMAIQSWKRLYIDYELVDGGSAPTLTVGYQTDPVATSYTTLTPNLVASGTANKRAKLNLFFQGRAVQFKFTQTNASTNTMLRSLEGEFAPLEPGRLVQP